MPFSIGQLKSAWGARSPTQNVDLRKLLILLGRARLGYSSMIHAGATAEKGPPASFSIGRARAMAATCARQRLGTRGRPASNILVCPRAPSCAGAETSRPPRRRRFGPVRGIRPNEKRAEKPPVASKRWVENGAGEGKRTQLSIKRTNSISCIHDVLGVGAIVGADLGLCVWLETSELLTCPDLDRPRRR